jgi:23S rRNA G2069 N7-methylase RlmK/C1962 C5-methylase RlmI
MLANRLRKRQRHLRKWARRNQITCYRLYERDIPEYPLIVDWYDGEAVAWLYQRTRDETPAQVAAWQQETLEQIQEGLELARDQIFVKERQRQKGEFQYERVQQREHVRIVAEQGLRFEVNLSDYLDTGLFLDHRITRDMMRRRAHGKRVLNLFAYTGTFTCYALDGGASATVTVDLSATYCDWAQRNLAHNGFAETPEHRVIQADCLAYLNEANQHRERFDLIVCDPPTFSSSKRMEASSFAVDRDHPHLIRQCVQLLTPGGQLFFSTNSRRFKLNERALPRNLKIENITQQTIPEDFRNQKIHQCWLMTTPR